MSVASKNPKQRWQRKIGRLQNTSRKWVDLIFEMNTYPMAIEHLSDNENIIASFESEMDAIYERACSLFEERVANQELIKYIFSSLAGILPFDDIVQHPRNSVESVRSLDDFHDFPHMNQFIVNYYQMIDEILIPQTINRITDIVVEFKLTPLSADNVCEILSFLDWEFLSQHDVECIVYRNM